MGEYWRLTEQDSFKDFPTFPDNIHPASRAILDNAASYVLLASDTFLDLDSAMKQALEYFPVSGPELSDHVNAVIGLGKQTVSLFED